MGRTRPRKLRSANILERCDPRLESTEPEPEPEPGANLGHFPCGESRAIISIKKYVRAAYENVKLFSIKIFPISLKPSLFLPFLLSVSFFFFFLL